MLQVYGEGFEILHAAKEYDLDLPAISHLWNRGSVVRSWLLELAEDAFQHDTNLESIRGSVADSSASALVRTNLLPPKSSLHTATSLVVTP
jgi:6-phosphogluconate dehydrogenase